MRITDTINKKRRDYLTKKYTQETEGIQLDNDDTGVILIKNKEQICDIIKVIKKVVQIDTDEEGGTRSEIFPTKRDQNTFLRILDKESRIPFENLFGVSDLLNTYYGELDEDEKDAVEKFRMETLKEYFRAKGVGTEWTPKRL